MRNLRAAAVSTVAIILSGCGTLKDFNEERYLRNTENGRAWLSDQILPAEINVSGTWDTPDWGSVSLFQTGRDVRGKLGDFPVEGVVSGSKVYLLASEQGWNHYSLILEMPGPDVLLGYYSQSVPYQSARRRDIRLDRVR